MLWGGGGGKWDIVNSLCPAGKAVNRGDKRTRRVQDRDFVKFERSRRYSDRYRCQEKKSRRRRALDPVFRDPPTPRTRPRSLFPVREKEDEKEDEKKEDEKKNEKKEDEKKED
jgi:hypothetical protein